LQDRYGIEATGAALIRPDGFIAWLSQAADTPSLDVISDAMRRVVGAETWYL
jgi:hypothetical protein